MLGTQCHTNSDGAALSQRAGGGVHARNLFTIGMPLQDTVELAEVGELVPADEATLRQHRIIAGGGMALAENEAITVGVLGIFGVDTHLSEEQGGHQLCGGQGAAGVAAAGVGRHVDDVPAHLFANAGKFCRIHG